MTIQNQAALEGTVSDTPEWSHENHGVRFYRFHLSIPRLSGQLDILPILAEEKDIARIHPGESLHVTGPMRSYNNRSGTGSRLVLTVYAKELAPGTGQPCNRIALSGSLCKPPVFRRTPLGRCICDLMLAVPRRCGRADYLPVIAWGQLAARTCSLCTGAQLNLEGRIQSRTYRKTTPEGMQERTAYEVSMMRMVE